MSEAKHTPGPWNAIQWSCHARTTVVAQVGDTTETRLVGTLVVAECAGHGRNASESEADAALIAAAPELLDAAESLLSWLRAFYPDEPLFSTELDSDRTNLAVIWLDKAIRKAKGEGTSLGPSL
jgi:hypothetical protein